VIPRSVGMHTYQVPKYHGEKPTLDVPKRRDEAGDQGRGVCYGNKLEEKPTASHPTVSTLRAPRRPPPPTPKEAARARASN
jgi:hypothetical protein